VLGVAQVAVGAPDRLALRALWVDSLGLVSKGTFQSVSENVDEEMLGLSGGADDTLEVDLMMPLDPTARPRVDQPALNHVGLWIDDLAAAHTWLGERGVRFTPGGIRRGASGHAVCFIHPKPAPDAPICGNGVLIELVQAPAELIARLASDNPC
jgi:lactoylglutathione lyase